MTSKPLPLGLCKHCLCFPLSPAYPVRCLPCSISAIDDKERRGLRLPDPAINVPLPTKE